MGLRSHAPAADDVEVKATVQQHEGCETEALSPWYGRGSASVQKL